MKEAKKMLDINRLIEIKESARIHSLINNCSVAIFYTNNDIFYCEGKKAGKITANYCTEQKIYGCELKMYPMAYRNGQRISKYGI